jgi:hypothetical protein
LTPDLAVAETYLLLPIQHPTGGQLVVRFALAAQQPFLRSVEQAGAIRITADPLSDPIPFHLHTPELRDHLAAARTFGQGERKEPSL